MVAKARWLWSLKAPECQVSQLQRARAHAWFKLDKGRGGKLCLRLLSFQQSFETQNEKLKKEARCHLKGRKEPFDRALVTYGRFARERCKKTFFSSEHDERPTARQQPERVHSLTQQRTNERLADEGQTIEMSPLPNFHSFS